MAAEAGRPKDLLVTPGGVFSSAAPSGCLLLFRAGLWVAPGVLFLCTCRTVTAVLWHIPPVQECVQMLWNDSDVFWVVADSPLRVQGVVFGCCRRSPW